MSWFRRHYGAGPLHLLSLIACALLAAYVVDRAVASGPVVVRIAIWFAGGAVAHDLVLWPLYALADRGAVRASRRHPDRLPRVPWINHVRVPAVVSGLLLLVSFPLVLRLSQRSYRAATGLSQAPFMGRWLLVSGALFGGSALLYAIRLGQARRRLNADVAPGRLPRHLQR